MRKGPRTRDIIFILAGILIMVFKNQYSGPNAEIFYNYGSNFSVSFAIYFIGLIGFRSYKYPRIYAAVGTLLAVELFELLNGFGVMDNVYDPWDYLANALGIAMALAIDLVMDHFSTRKNESPAANLD